MKVLINNSEQVQPKERGDTLIKLFGRTSDEPEEVQEITVHGFDPYFYAPKEEVNDKEGELIGQDCIDKIEYGEFRGFPDDRNLAKIYTPYPQDVPEAKEFFSDTWEADVPFTNRFRVDTEFRDVIEVPGTEVHWREISPVEPGSPDANPRGNTSQTTLQNVDPRVCTLDIEVDDRADGFPESGEERILSIVAHDSYDDELVAFFDTEGRSPGDCFPDGAPDDIDAIYASPDEKEMLYRFIDWFNEKDPDLITGWNADDFDIPFIIRRMENLGVGPNQMSRLGWSGITRGGEPRIKGRTVYDLLTVYKKNSFTELRSYSLNDVAKEELGAEKIEFEGDYYDLYKDDPTKFIRYNARDVTLTAEINEEAGVIEFRDALRREVGVDFEDSYDNKDFVDMMCRRKLKEMDYCGPTRPDYGDEPDSDYEGAHVFDAYEGVAENVVGVDLASLYPYTMAMLNASPETKVDPDEYDGPMAHAANDVWFALDQDGLFKQLVDEAISLKAEYKEKRNNAESDAEYEYWAVKYMSAKTITNSLYGVTGWERFFLYDEDVAAAVTLTGQFVIKETADYVEESGFEVLYGDTDSTYVKFPDGWSQEECLNAGRELCTDLNETIYPELAAQRGIPEEDNLWDIEVEAHMERFFQAGKKKRYAYVATWKDGREVEHREPSITGFASRRSDTSRLTVETEKEVLDAILSGNAGEVSDIIFDASREITDNPDWEMIGIPGGMSKGITDDPTLGESDEYYAVSCDDHGNCYPQSAHPRAVYNASQILDVHITSDSKPMRVYLRDHWFDEVGRNIDVIAFEKESDLDEIKDEVHIDAPRMTNTLLVNPLQQICDAIDVDITAAVRGQEQTNLGAF